MAIHGSLLTACAAARALVWIQTSRRAGSGNRHGATQRVGAQRRGGAVSAYSGPELRDNLGLVLVTSGMLTEEDLRPRTSTSGAMPVRCSARSSANRS